MAHGRISNHLYLAVDTGREGIADAPKDTRDPVDALVDGIERSAAQQMAIDSVGISR